MSPDAYLHFAGIFIGYFLKVAVAYLLCLLLGRLLKGARQRFAIWLGFMLGALAYWVYVLISSFPLSTFSADAAHAVTHSTPRLSHEFLVPIGFEHPAVVFAQALGYAYVLGALVLVAAGILKLIKLHFFLRNGSAPSGDLMKLFAEMCRNFRVRRCELLIMPKVSSPATVCWWRPRILLPPVCEQLGASGVMADILYHELAHVARRDYFWSTINDLICRLLFFHPALWQARKQMRIHREVACDLAVVVARPEHRADYAHTLTRVARLCLPRKYPIVGIDFASASLLSHRVHAILNQPEQSSWQKRFSRALASTALVSTYGFLCSALAIGIAFAPPAERPDSAVAIEPTPKVPAHPGTRHKAKTAAVSQDEEGLITESPAYRLGTSPHSPVVDSGLSPISEESAGADSDNVNSGRWTGSLPGQKPKSASATVESVIVATVGTIIGTDKDDRATKHKDSSH